MAEAASAAARQLSAFKLGRKQVFLPNHVVVLLRKNHLPPNEACFRVPLRFTKLDLRDYLWNLYNVEVRKVRSYVKQQPLVRRHSLSQSYYRPLSLKIMLAELTKPFIWPEVPKNLTPWSGELWRIREELMEKRSKEHQDRADMHIPLISKQPWSTERHQLANLAAQMLEGKVKWFNDVKLDPKWDHLLAKDQDKDKAVEDQSRQSS